MVPAATSWLIIIGMLVLTIYQPVLSALVIIAFVFSWLVRMLYSNILLGVSFTRLRAEKDTDWLLRLRGMTDITGYAESLRTEPCKKNFYVAAFPPSPPTRDRGALASTCLRPVMGRYTPRGDHPHCARKTRHLRAGNPEHPRWSLSFRQDPRDPRRGGTGRPRGEA